MGIRPLRQKPLLPGLFPVSVIISAIALSKKMGAAGGYKPFPFWLFDPWFLSTVFQ
jgi:hypothetical protein